MVMVNILTIKQLTIYIGIVNYFLLTMARQGINNATLLIDISIRYLLIGLENAEI